MAADTEAAHPVVAGDEKPTVDHASSTDVAHVEGGEKPAQTYLPRSDEEYEVTFKVCSDNYLSAFSSLYASKTTNRLGWSLVSWL